MSDSNYCKDCHSRDCQCFPDYESPVNELDRLRKENPGLRARVAELEAELAQLKAQDEWTTFPPKEHGYYWIRQADRRPTDHPKLVFIGEWVYDGVIRYPISSFVDDWEFRKAR